MNTNLVVTILGSDRPGLVEGLSEIVAKHSGNWEQSRMAHLAGRFAGILRVSVPAAQADELLGALAALEQQGLRVSAERSDGVPVDQGYRPMRLELVGNDHPGIVRDISRALATRGVNVEELSTETESAPQAGGLLFRAKARLSVPHALQTQELLDVLEGLANDLIVEIELANG